MRYTVKYIKNEIQSIYLMRVKNKDKKFLL